MKKTVSLILALILTCTTLFSLTSCFGSSADVDALNAKIAELTERLNATNSKISTLEAEKAAQADEITTLKAGIKVLEAEKATLAANKATLEAEKSLLEEEITDLEAEIARLQALMDGNSNALLEEIAKLEAQVESLAGEVATLKSDKANLESQITSLNAQISTLDAEKATLTARVTELESSIAAKNTEIANLNSTVSTLTTEKNNLIAEKNALVTENSELKEENKELTDLVAALRNCLKGIHSYVNGFCSTCGKEDESTPAYTRDGDYIYFGEYPQTIKADSVTITSTQDSRGYYLGSDGNYYAKVTATPYESGYTFSTGSTVTSGSVYYFKVESIRWRILSEENGIAFILCDSIIANHRFDDDSNDYAKSEIREWLNENFYEAAFNTLQHVKILTTEVDNSAKSTNPYGEETCWNSGVNQYACENTNDKIFLLSEEEATNDAYGFAPYTAQDTAREMLTSDYSRATGVWMRTRSDYYGNGWWFRRSPSYVGSSYACGIDHDGTAYITSYVTVTSGVVPALRIRL